MDKCGGGQNDDADLVARVRGGDKQAFGAIVERYHAALLGVGRSRSHSHDDAADAVQNALLLAYVHLGQLRDPAKLGPWLRRLTINACFHQRVKPTVSLQFVPETGRDDREANDTRLLLDQALACLSPETRLTIILYYQKQFSLREIAAFQEVPPTTIKSRLRNARARLRKEMELLLETTILDEMELNEREPHAPRLLRRLDLAGTVFQLAFSPNGTHLVTVASLEITGEKWDSVIACWDMAGKPVWSVNHASWVFSPVFLPDGERVAVAAGLPGQRGGKTGLLLLLDTADGSTVQTIKNVPGAKSIAITPDGRHIALGGAEDYEDYRSNGQRGMAVIYDLASGEQLLKIAPHLNYITALAFSPDGVTLASSSHLRDADPEAIQLWRGGDIRLWDTTTGMLKHKLSRDDRGTRHNITFSPDGILLAAPNGWEGEVRIWEAATGAVVRTLPGNDEPVFVQAFSPDGKTLACGCGDNTVRLWDVQTGTMTRTISEFSHCIYALAFSPDGEILATADKNGVVQFWDW